MSPLNPNINTRREQARNANGTFGEQHRSDPEPILILDEINNRMLDEYFAQPGMADAFRAHYALGEDFSRHEDSARDSHDPALLTLHTRDRRSLVAEFAAANPCTPAHALHYLMVEEDRTFGHEARIRAVLNPNADPASIRNAVERWAARARWSGPDPEISEIASYMARTAAVAPNASPDLLAELYADPWTMSDAAEHPSLPRECIELALNGDAYSRRVVMRNPALTAEDIDVVVEHAARDYVEDESEVTDEMTALYLAAKHPNTRAETYRALANHSERHVAKTASDQIVGDFIREGYALGEAILMKNNLISEIGTPRT